MSLFIGTLAFAGPEHAAEIRIGVLAGSMLSAALAALVLGLAAPAVNRPLCAHFSARKSISLQMTTEMCACDRRGCASSACWLDCFLLV